MKKYIKTILVTIIAGTVMIACETTTPKEDTHEEGENEENTVSLTQKQADVLSLEFIQIQNRSMNSELQATGKLELAPEDKADVSAILGGMIKEIKVFEGDKIKRGKVLAVMEHPQFIQLQQDYISNLNRLDFLEKDYLRQKKLYEEKVGSGKDFQKISADYFNSKSSLAAQKIKLQMLGINTEQVAKGKIYSTVNIVSPINGKISLVETNVGAFAQPETKLFEIVNNAKIHADLMIFDKDISKVKVGQQIFFTTSSLEGQELEGEIYAISPAFEGDSKAVHVHARIFEKNEAMISGMYIKGRVITDNVLTAVLPEHAIVSEDGKSYIFIESEEKHEHQEEEYGDEVEEAHDHEGDDDDHNEEEVKYILERVEVITGISSAGYVEVKLLKDLSSDTQIVGKSAYYLLAEMGKGETEHSH